MKWEKLLTDFSSSAQIDFMQDKYFHILCNFLTIFFHKARFEFLETWFLIIYGLNLNFPPAGQVGAVFEMATQMKVVNFQMISNEDISEFKFS